MPTEVLVSKSGHDAHGVIAVVVTRNRPVELDRLLGALSRQEEPPIFTIVVDNGAHDETRRVLAGYANVRHIPSRRNLGGAGGFVLGVMLALAEGADYVWLMDDDGLPETDQCLCELKVAIREQSLDMASPLIVDIEDPSRLAFYHYHGRRPINDRAEAVRRPVLRQFANLFNGALVRASCFERFGLPRYELFFRGDETDFLFRLNRDGARFATITRAAFLHPSGSADTVPIFKGRYHAVIPANETTRFYYYRNRGALFREFRLPSALVYDLIRYSWAFLIVQRCNWKGWVHWADAVWLGFRRKFVRPISGRDTDR